MADDLAYEDLEAGSVVGYVRSLIPDMEQLADPADPTIAASYLFDDATLERYILFARNGHPKRAAADACMALAGSELLILKKITTEDLMTDGAAVAKEHRERATRLRKEADEDEASEEDNSGMFIVGFRKYPRPFDAEARIRRGGRFGW